MTAPFRKTEAGVSIDVEVKVRASRTRVLGIKGERLSVSLAAPPVDGAANEALCRALAEFFEVPRGRVQLCGGQRSRRKVVEVTGLDEHGARARLSRE